MKTRLAVICCVSILIFMIAGCGQTSSEEGQEAPGAVVIDSKPITLKVFQYTSSITDEEFKRFIADPVHAKYPNITMELIRSQKGTTMDDLLTAGQFPDLIYTGTNSMSYFFPNQLPYDLYSLIKKYKFDTSQYDDAVMDSIQVYGEHGETYALPFSTNFSFIVYNKDIFDKFGVAYPKDRMIWDDVIELAKKVSRSEGGAQYYGLEPADAIKFGSPLSIPTVDAKTDKSVLNSEGWQKVINLLKKIADDTGNKDIAGKVEDKFIKDQAYAMLVTYGDFLAKLEDAYQSGSNLKWDIASYPSFKEAPGLGLRSVSHVLMISSTSQHKDEAFQAMAVAIGKEVQSTAARTARISALKDPALRKDFGADMPSLKGKNVQAVFIAKPAPNPPPTLYIKQAEAILNQTAKDVLAGKTDTNTALRNADEQLNQQIAEIKSSMK